MPKRKKQTVTEKLLSFPLGEEFSLLDLIATLTDLSHREFDRIYWSPEIDGDHEESWPVALEVFGERLETDEERVARVEGEKERKAETFSRNKAAAIRNIKILFEEGIDSHLRRITEDLEKGDLNEANRIHDLLVGWVENAERDWITYKIKDPLPPLREKAAEEMAVGTRSWTPELIAISQRLQDEWEAKKARWREESRVKREEKKWEQQELARLKEQVPPEERRVDPPS